MNESRSIAERQMEELVRDLNGRGIKGLKNRAVDWGIKTSIHKIKSKFGLDMEFNNPFLCEIATKWIKKHDPKFKQHILNPYNYEDIGYHPILSDNFFIVLDKHTLAYVSATYKKTTVSNNNNGWADDQNIYVYIFGRHMLHYFKELREEIMKSRNSSFMLYTITGRHDTSGKSWFQCIGEPMKPRPMDTLYFEQGVKEKVINHLNSWLENAPIYEDRGLTFKTGILVHGVAGTGKSSLATAIATYLKCSVVVIDTSSFSYIDVNEVTKSIDSDDEMYVVLLDEVDAIFKSRDDVGMTETEKNNVIKLLSFLDSPMSPNKVVFVATTNYYDRLDPAVKRKGRFDLEIELGNINYQTALEMCSGFNLTPEKTKMVMSHHKQGDLINPAALQAQILSVLSNKDVKDDIVVEEDGSVKVEEEDVSDAIKEPVIKEPVVEEDDDLPNHHDPNCDESGESDASSVLNHMGYGRSTIASNFYEIDGSDLDECNDEPIINSPITPMYDVNDDDEPYAFTANDDCKESENDTESATAYVDTGTTDEWAVINDTNIEYELSDFSSSVADKTDRVEQQVGDLAKIVEHLDKTRNASAWKRGGKR